MLSILVQNWTNGVLLQVSRLVKYPGETQQIGPNVKHYRKCRQQANICIVSPLITTSAFFVMPYLVTKHKINLCYIPCLCEIDQKTFKTLLTRRNGRIVNLPNICEKLMKLASISERKGLVIRNHHERREILKFVDEVVSTHKDRESGSQCPITIPHNKLYLRYISL